MHNETDFDSALNQAVTAVRTADPDPAVAEAAAPRVWQQLAEGSVETRTAPASASDGAIRSCEDVRALLPAYQSGTLPEAREWLVQDHLRECPDCRKVAQGANARRAAVLPWRQTGVAAAPKIRSTQKLAWAAAMFVTVGLSAYALRDRFLPAPEGPRASLEWSDGPVYVVKATAQRTLTPGGGIGETEWVRTGASTRAIFRLRDGSRVEMNQLAEMNVNMNRRDTTVNVERGAIIVNAAKRRSGHLYVSTRDANVAVTGTVFAVNRGMKGTRVSVAEGEVHVDSRGNQHILHAGEQMASNDILPPVPVREEFAWSRNVDEHLKLMAAMNVLAKQVETIELPGLRYSSAVLPVMPAGTFVYAAIPNLGETLAKAHQMFQDGIRDNAALNEWWTKQGSKGDPGLERVIEFVRGVSEYLGDEVVLAVTGDPQKPTPVLIAEVRKEGLREYIEKQLATLGASGRPQLVFSGKFVLVSPDAAALPKVELNGGLNAQPFGKRVAEAYQDGAGFLFAADLSRIAPPDKQAAAATGFDDVRYLVVEQRQIDGGTNESRATLSFAGPRHGLASWLAKPAPMGSLAFVSSNATLAASFVVKEPAKLIDDLFALAETTHAGFREEIRKVEAETGIRFREDLAASLGNDVTISIDGPVLPVPAWKVIVEAHDPARIEQSIRQLVETCNKHQAGCAAIKPVASPNRTINSVEIGATGQGFVYTLTDGYLIVASNNDTLQRGLRAKDGSWGLVESGRYRSLLPHDREANFSAVVYHNLTDIGRVVSDAMNASGSLTPEQRARVESMAASAKPGLIYAYGLDDRIQIASTAGFFGFTLDNIVSSGGIAQLLHRHTPGPAPARMGERAAARERMNPRDLPGQLLMPQVPEPRKDTKPGFGKPPAPPEAPVPPRPRA